MCIGILLLAASGCGRPRAEPAPLLIDIDRVWRHAEHLTTTIGPRPEDTEASRHAADYIEAELAAMGLRPERHPVGPQTLPDISIGPFEIVRSRVVRSQDPNLVVRFASEAGVPALLLMAHYDTVDDSPGAVDNAAAVALLLELAGHLGQHPPPRPVILAFTAAEEVGLIGARGLANTIGARVGLAVSLDMLGHATTELNGLGPLIGRDWLHWIDRTCAGAGVLVPAPQPMRIVSRLFPQVERSDHGVFAARGIPAFHLFGRGESRIFRHYHTAADTMDRLDRQVLASTGRLVTALAFATEPFPSAGGDPGMWIDFGDRVIIAPRWLVVAISVLLGLIAVFALPFAVRRRQGGHVPADHRPRLALGLTIAGIVPLLLVGLALLLLGVHELAWAAMAAAALMSLAHLVGGRLGFALFVLSLAPIWPALSPAFIRELSFHTMAPRSAVIAYMFVVLLPHILAAMPHLARIGSKR